MRTFLATLFIAISGTLILWISTDGGRAFTAEEARRLEIRETPRAVPIGNCRTRMQKLSLFKTGMDTSLL